MVLILALCHTVVYNNIDGRENYESTSPDELALVQFAAFVGVKYLGTDEDNVIRVMYKNHILK